MKMIKTVLSNLFHKEATRLYPITKREEFPNVRGRLENNIDSCIFCGLCSKKCPVSCIKVDRAAKTWEHNPYQCIYCGLCVEVCPTKSLKQNSAYTSPTYQKQDTILQGKEKDTPKVVAEVDAKVELTVKVAKEEEAKSPKVKVKKDNKTVK